MQVGDLIFVPGRGLRLQRAVLKSGAGGMPFMDSLRASAPGPFRWSRIVVPIVDRWADGKDSDDFLFAASHGGAGRVELEALVDWPAAIEAIGKPTLRVHDLRHTAASVWLAAGADAKVVQRILGHASSVMDVYGHLVYHNLWDHRGSQGLQGGLGDVQQALPEE